MSDKINTVERPLSPHVQVYRMPMTAKMSIFHRATGVALSAGLVILAIWLIAAGLGEERYDQFMALVQMPYAHFLFSCFAFALFYHMGNGVRHVFWDIGVGLNKKTAEWTGWLVLLFAFGATFAIRVLTCDCFSNVIMEVSNVAG